jgi:hypothetical protein
LSASEKGGAIVFPQQVAKGLVGQFLEGGIALIRKTIEGSQDVQFDLIILPGMSVADRSVKVRSVLPEVVLQRIGDASPRSAPALTK